MLSEPELIAYLDNTLSPADRRRVEEELARDPELRQLVVRQAQMDRALGVMLGEPAANERVKQAVLATVHGESDEALKRQVLEETKFLRRPPSLGRRLRAWWDRLPQPTAGWVMACAAAGLVLLGVLVLPPIAKRSYSGSPIEMPSLVEAPAGSEWRRGESLLSQDARRELQAGDVLVVATNGSTTVGFEDGTVIHLEPGTRLIFNSPTNSIRRGGKQFMLLTGTISADVRKQPAHLPLLIHTPHAVATVLGTEFDLAVTGGQTQLEVTRGTVSLAGAGQAQPVNVTAGELAVASPGTEPRAQPLARNPQLWPFASDSPWNRPLGSGAKLEPVRARPFLADGPLMNSVRPRRPFRGGPADTLRGLWVNDERLGDVRISDPSVMPIARNEPFTLLQAGRRYACELIDVRIRPDGDLEARDAVRTDLAGTGAGQFEPDTKPWGFSSLGGLVRVGEYERGIPHALAARVGRDRLNSRTPEGRPCVWPAVSSRTLPARSGDPTSNLHIGNLLAIPPEVDITKLGFGTSGPGYELARAMQDFGVYVTGVFEAPFVLLTGEARLSPAEEDALLTKLVPLLQVVTNNTEQTPGGGGAPRRALAPALPPAR